MWTSPCTADCSPLVIPSAGGTDWAFPSAFPVLFQPSLSIGVLDPNYFNTNNLWPKFDLFAPIGTGLFTAATGKCASGIFDVVFNHCDFGDGVLGAIAPDGIVGFQWETWLVRQSVAEIPEPATLALFGIGLMGLGFMMRRRTGRLTRFGGSA